MEGVSVDRQRQGAGGARFSCMCPSAAEEEGIGSRTGVGEVRGRVGGGSWRWGPPEALGLGQPTEIGSHDHPHRPARHVSRSFKTHSNGHNMMLNYAVMMLMLVMVMH